MAETELKVILKSKELAEHTLRVTSNANRYPKKYRFSLVDKMQNKSLEIFEYLHGKIMRCMGTVLSFVIRWIYM